MFVSKLFDAKTLLFAAKFILSTPIIMFVSFDNYNHYIGNGELI
jgi:hypothetical protein